MLLKLAFYYTMKALMSVYIRLYFGRVEIVGRHKIPVGKPIIFSCNHQNAFMDALLIGIVLPIRITSMSRSDVFNTPLRWFLDALQMLPIYRMRDGIDKLARNEQVFEKIRGLLRENKAILIFSEGNHGNDYYLRPLTKGSSRMALESMERMPEKDIQVMPVGLNYFHHQRPCHKLTVTFGDPVPVRDYFSAYEQHPVRGANQLKEAIARGMEKCLLIPQKTDDYLDRREYINRYNEGYRFADLRERIEKKDPELKKRGNPDRSLLWAGKILGVFNFLPLLILQKVLAPIKDIVFYGSIKYAFGFFVFPLWYLTVYGVTAPLIGWQYALGLDAVLLLLLFLRQQVIRRANPPH